MLRQATLVAAAVAAIAIAPVAAFAGTQEDVDACVAKMRSEKPSATFKFKRKSGASTKTYTFDMIEGEARATATCKVKRGEIKEINYRG